MNNKITKLQDEITKLKTTRDDRGDELQQQKSAIVVLREEKSRLTEEKKAEEANARSLNKEIKELKAVAEKQTKQIKTLEEEKIDLEAQIGNRSDETDIQQL